VEREIFQSWRHPTLPDNEELKSNIEDDDETD